jgi:CHAD domain-containing protein
MIHLTLRQEMLNYFQVRFSSFTANYQRALEKDPEGIHDLRVDMKRIKAFFNLLGCFQKKFHAKEEFLPFKTLAKNTSNIRDVQVQRKLLDIMKKKARVSVKVYESFLAARENRYMETFEIFIQKKNRRAQLDKVHNTINTSLVGVLKKEARKRAKGHFTSLINKVIILNETNALEKKQLHRVRILSKQIQYTFEIMREYLQMFQKGDVFLDEVIQVNRILGKLHDMDISLDYLDDFLTKHSTCIIQKQHQKLMLYIHRDKDSLTKTYLKHWNNLITIAQSL